MYKDNLIQYRDFSEAQKMITSCGEFNLVPLTKSFDNESKIQLAKRH